MVPELELLLPQERQMVPVLELLLLQERQMVLVLELLQQTELLELVFLLLVERLPQLLPLLLVAQADGCNLEPILELLVLQFRFVVSVVMAEELVGGVAMLSSRNRQRVHCCDEVGCCSRVV